MATKKSVHRSVRVRMCKHVFFTLPFFFFVMMCQSFTHSAGEKGGTPQV